MEDLIQVIFQALAFIIIFIFRFVLPNLNRSSKKDDDSSAPEAPSPARTPPEPLISLDAIEKLKRQATSVQQTINTLEQHSHILAEALETTIENAQQDIRVHIAQSQDTAARAAYNLAIRRIHLISALTKARAHPEIGAHLADAEALADAFLVPFKQLSRTTTFPFTVYQPICVPADEYQESIWFGLLPPAYPIIFVPPDFGKNLYRWASLPHEIGHLLWRHVPNFASETRERWVQNAQGLLPFIENDTLHFHIDEPIAAWLEELFADTFTIMTLGPAALKGMVESFTSPRNPDQVAWAHSEGQYFSPHPPAHLRVLLGAKVLWQMGFDAEAKAYLDSWNELHDEPDVIYIPGPNHIALSIETETFMTHLEKVVLDYYQGAYQSLDGRELRSIHGVVVGPGQWGQVQRLIPDITKGQAVHADPKLVLMAGIIAFSEAPNQRLAIKSAVEQAILGRGSDEPKVKPRKKNLAKRKGLNRSDIDAALVLHEVLKRPITNGR